MKKQAQTMEEALQTFVTDECLSSSEEEVNLETEQDFTETEENFFDSESDTEIEIEAYPEGDDDPTVHKEVELTPDELAYIQFVEQLRNNGCNNTMQADRIVAVTELARFGQTCTNDKQRETILDIMWMCAMDRFMR